MMHQHVALADHREDVVPFTVGLSEARLRDRRPRRRTQRRTSGQPRELPEVVHVEQPRNRVDLTRFDAHRVHQFLAQPWAQVSFDLKPYDFTERAPPQLGLDGFE